MIIDLKKIRLSGKDEQNFFFEYFPETELVDIPNAELTLPVKVEGTAYLTGNHTAYVEGSVNYSIKGECTRCLAPATKEFVIDFAENFDGDNETSYPVVCDRLDLSQIVNDLIIMNIPVSFLCKEDCKGLCTVCGANLNEGECQCEK